MAPSKSQGFVEPVNPPPTSFLSSKTTSCHTSHQNSDRLKYFRAMELLLQPPTNPNVKLSHTVVVGDLVSYTHDGKHEIGQVLTFYERKSRESGTIDGFAVLRPFLHWDNIKYQPNNKRNRRMLSVNDTKQISQSMRFDVALFEQTDIVHTVNLEQIHIGKLITSSVPGISAMADARNFRPQRIDASGTRGKDNLQVWEMNRIILYRLEAAAADEQTYHAIPINDWKNYNLDFSQTVPGPLRRGWDCLENAVLVDDMAKEFQSHVKAILAEDRCLLERIQTEPQVAESEIKPAAVESLNRKPVREETKHRQKSKSKQAKRGVKRASTIKNAKKTAPKKQKTGRQGVTGSDVDEDCESDDDSQYSEQSINVQAVSDSIYTLSGKVRGDASKPALHFFTQIQLSTDKYATDTSLHGKMASHWILSVGDLIAVHCLEATLPSTGKADKGKQNKKPWFPFARPWSAAQVVSIYKVEGASQFLMELRWLYRPHELEPNVQANLTSDMRQQLFDGKKRSGTVNIHTMVEADEYVTEAPVESALGRVKVMGTDSPRIAKAVPGLSTDMMPQIFVSIPYVYRMQYDETTIRPAKGWESYGSTIQTGPLHQALFCEKGWPGRKEGKQLRKKYKAFFVKKYDLQTGEDVRERRDEIGDAEEDTDAIMAEQMGTLIHYHREWPVELKEQKTFAVSTDHSRCLHTVDVGKNRTREYLHAIHVPVIRKRCDARATASKAVASEQFWKLQIGDFVCLMDDKASREAVAKGQNPWYPFLGPWSVCQVLCIYQEKTRRGSPSVPLLEIRRFFHRNDMPSNVQAWMPPPADKQRDSCFETNHVESDVPALQVLGRAVLFLGRHIDSASSNESVDSPVPSTSCRCSFFYDVSRQTFQPLFCSSKTPAGWLMRMLKRGFKASALLKEDLVLKENVASNFNLIEDVFDLDKMLQDDDKEDDPVPVPLETSTSVDTSLFLSVPLRPEWSVYVDSEYICAASDRENLIWQARVGDVVAVRTLADECSGEAAFPFSVAWMVGQVLSLFRSTGGDMQAEIRWLDRRSDPVNQTIDTVFEPQTSKTVELSVTDLLSPVTLVDNERAQTPWNISFPFLPLIVMKCGGQAHKEVATERIPFVANSMVARGLILSSRYGELDRTSIFGQIAGDDPSLKEREENETVTANSLFSPQKTYIDQDPTTPKDLSTKAGLLSLSLPSNPFHCDKSARIEFFKSLGLVVPQSLSAFGQMKELGKPWRVKSGDAVILQYDVGKARVKSADCAPFKMPWGIAEVVTIYKHLDKDADDANLEIRWFYRPEDIPGSHQSELEDIDSILEEVFESDHYDDVPASTLLAPAQLLDLNSAQTAIMDSRFTFICRSFWSQKNKSIVPTGGLAGRIERGRRFSKFYSQLGDVSSNENARESALTKDNAPTSIVSAFEQVIVKMSLTDASKEAINDGDGIVGRQKERKTIEEFLRLAIAGRINDKRPSIFVAGPPGVGKTACVRAVVGDLQREQTAGKLRPFKFISINGMELRHPLEFYSKYLELLTGERVNSSAKAASQRLDNYFGKPEGEESTIVLLVDEIDYLVTKQQTVIYSLFDWPARSAETLCPRRLVLIGISNTLNLPEQMHPRVQSRLGSHRCPFRAYGIPEAADILKAKLKLASPNFDIFKPDCIQFVAKKTASMSGDIRKAFIICRTAAELVLEDIESGKIKDERPQVTMSYLFAVSKDTFNSPQSNRMNTLAAFEVLVIVALASLTKSTGREQGGFDVDEIVTKMEAMVNALGDNQYIPPPSLTETLQLLAQLGTAHLISLQTPRNASITRAGTGGPWPLSKLLVDETVVWVALKDTPHNPLVKRYLKR